MFGVFAVALNPRHRVKGADGFTREGSERKMATPNRDLGFLKKLVNKFRSRSDRPVRGLKRHLMLGAGDVPPSGKKPFGNSAHDRDFVRNQGRARNSQTR